MKGLLPGRARDGGPLARAMAAVGAVFAALLVALWDHAARAEVTRIEVLDRAPLAAAMALRSRGLLLSADVPAIVARAGRTYDAVTEGRPGSPSCP